MITRQPVLLLAAFALALGAAGARDAGAGNRCRRATVPTSADLAAPGPYPWAVQTFPFVDRSRPTAPNGTFPGAPERTLTTEVWYPGSADGALLSGAPYPVVMHSHGFMDNRTGEQYLTEHLASHGYVVASIDYPLSNGGAPGGATVADVHNQPGDLSFVLDQLLALSGGTGLLADAIDDERVGASGLSLGGLTTLLATYHRTLREPRIKAAMSMAGPSCMFTKRFFRTTKAPLLVLHGDGDFLVPYELNGRRLFRFARGRRHLVLLQNGSHTGFSAFAPFLNQSKHLDCVGCLALLQGLGDLDQTPFSSLGGKREGVNLNPKRCPLPCLEDPCQVGPSMDAARQHELTRIVATAFFDAYLRRDTGARCFLRRRLRRDHNDITVRSR